jgi:tRNA(fMet)-specific endonuclease VapC
MQYLADTDWVISYQRDVAPGVQRFDSLLPDGIGLSIISVAELYDGILGSPDLPGGERSLRDFLAMGIGIVDVDAEICRIFARERGRLRVAGMLIPDFDLLIGATALRYNLTLLSNNRRHFERLMGLRIISA